MPIIDGKLVRARYTSLKLGEISSVDNPAQPGARATVIKRVEGPDRAETLAFLEKYVGTEDGAHTFSEVLRENKFSEQIWPFTDALSQSIRSIVGDKALTGADREAKVTATVSEFLGAVRSISPEVGKQLEGLISKREDSMPKTVDQLEGEVTTLKSDLAAATARAEKAEGDLKAKTEECDEAKKSLTAATDEVITVGGQELRKSVVGDASFSVAKAMREERDTAVFEKRAELDFHHVVGTVTEKALALKAIDGLDDEAKKAALAVFTAAEKMAKAGFDTLGHGHGEVTETEKQAQSTFAAKVHEIAKRDNCEDHEAMRKARSEFPQEFAAAYPEQAAN